MGFSMTARLRFSLLTLATALLLLLWMVGSAFAECGYFKPLSDLTAEMRMVATGQAPRSTATARRVAQHVQNVEFGEVQRRLQRMSLSAQFHYIEQLATIATEYSETMRTTNQVALARTVHNVETILEQICGSQFKDRSFNSESGASGEGYLIAMLRSDNDILQISLLFIFLAGVIGLLILSKHTLEYATGLWHHKKICRVPASICGNEQTFLGNVTRAGLDGVRFEFDSDVVAKRLTDLLASSEFIHFDLWIDDDNWPVFVDEYHKFFSPLYFLTRLTRKKLDNILARSTRAIQDAPSIGHKSTRRNWHAQIAQRKASILNASRQRAGSG